GCGGFATFRFDNNTLANGPGPDLDIEERGGSEAFLVQVSKDGDNWVDIGSFRGRDARAIDLANTAASEGQYRFLRIVDLKTSCSGSWPGADIGPTIRALNGTNVGDRADADIVAPPVIRNARIDRDVSVDSFLQWRKL
ncbi:MAG: hypothetical protein AAGG69_13340, partial [Pseudomonadota bacterium]